MDDRMLSEPNADVPQYRALQRVLTAPLTTATLLVTVFGVLVSLCATALSLFASSSELMAELFAQIGDPHALSQTELLSIRLSVGIMLVPALAFSLLPCLAEWLLIRRARRGKPLRRAPFTLLRIYLIFLIAFLGFDLFFYLLSYSAVETTTLSVVSVVLTLAAYVFLLRATNYLREVALFGRSARKLSFSLVAFVTALQALPTLTDMLLTVLQRIDPQYYKLTAYTCTTDAEFWLTVASSTCSVAVLALSCAVLLKCNKKFSADEP